MKNLLFVFTCISFWILTSCNQPASDEADAATTSADTTQTTPPVEFADPKYMEIGKKLLASMASGNVDEYAAAYADNAIYRWNNGDSLAGKAAIHDFWKKRLTETVASLSFSEQIFLPVDVNQPQANEDAGTWLLAWYRVDATYKTGKSMTQWMHMVLHSNDNDLIDQVVQYRDNVPIIAAATK